MKYFEDYRTKLKKEYAKRAEANSSFSQRAFAKNLDLSRTQLNEVLAGKRGLSKETASKIADKLGFDLDEKNHFVDLVLSESSRSKIEKDLAIKRVKERLTLNKNINEDMLSIISDWYHFAILELTYIKDFEFNVQNISSRLKISKIEVELAIERLCKANLLKIEDNKATASEDLTISSDGIPSSALKKAHHQFLQKASRALITQTIDERNFNSNILAIDSTRISEAKEMINEFKNNFLKEFGIKNACSKDAVYALTTQFFSLEK